MAGLRNDASVGVNLYGKDVSASAALKRVGKNAFSVSKTLKSLGATAVRSFALIATAATAAAIKVGKDSIQAASELAESTSKTQAVFKANSQEILSWSRTSAEAFGQSQKAALEAVSTYGNLFQAFGIAAPKAAKMSMTLTELASDLASFNNTSVDEAIQALRSGVSGETEPLKRYGVAINDVRLKEQALRMGLIKTTKGTLPIAIKTQAAYALIMKDTALAQGDFARTSDGLANQQRTLNAEWENAKAALGQSLIEPALRFVKIIREDVLPAFSTFVSVLTGNEPKKAERLATARADDFRATATPMQEAAGKLAGSMREFAEAIGLLNSSSAGATGSTSPLVKLFNLLSSLFGVMTSIINGWKRFDAAIKEMTGYEEAKKNKPITNTSWNPKLPKWLDPFDIHGKVEKGKRAFGGPVSTGTYLVGERGPELLHMGAGRTGYITPRIGNSGTTVVLNVQGSVVSQKDLSKAIRDDIAQLMRRQGANAALLGVGR